LINELKLVDTMASKSDEARIGIFERKVLRAIFGPTNDNGRGMENKIQ